MLSVIKSSTSKSKEIKAIGISLLFLILGFLVVWFTKVIAKIEGETIYISLLLIPIITYTIISGRLKLFKGPGGLEARFSETTVKSGTPDSPCHKYVDDDWQKEKLQGNVTNIVDAILKFQKTVLEKGCENYLYSLDLEGLGKFSTKYTFPNKSNNNIRKIQTALEIGHQGMHNTWKAQKSDENNNWEITLII